MYDIKKIGRAEIHNCDNMEYMKGCKDNQFDLAICDPPYGMMDSGAQSGGEKGVMENRAYKMENISKWDKAPDKIYFSELFRVSKNQIIWGGNYFNLPSTRGVICWDKCQPWPNFSAWEMAWTSFGCVARIFKFDNRTGDKIHPTQKPVKLYEWLLTNYAKQGDTIIDTHMGSGSIAIATNKLGFDLTACELDKDYYKAACKRIENESKQVDMFSPPLPELKQGVLI